MINGVLKSPLKIVRLNDGNVMHAMKNKDQGYTQFGEAYFSIINSGAIKGWKRHKKMYCNLSVPHGKVKFVIKLEDKFKEFEISNSSPALLTIFPNTFFAFKGLEDLNVISNLASLEHDSKESENIPLKEINYEW